jgi:hypothetical protein
LCPHACRLEIPGNAVQREFLLDSLLVQPLPLPFARLLAVKSIFHYYSWQWQLVLLLRPYLDAFKILIFYFFSLHRIFEHMHKTLNIDRK